MGRDLKFRAWDHERGVMVYGQDIEEYEDELDEVSYTYHATRYQTGLSYGKLFVAYISKSGDFTKCEVMQFTGLRDNKGQEVYEGDIVQLPWPSGIFSADIVFKAGAFEFNLPMGGAELCPAALAGNIEVIGNIHEHPHLLQS